MAFLLCYYDLLIKDVLKQTLFLILPLTPQYVLENSHHCLLIKSQHQVAFTQRVFSRFRLHNTEQFFHYYLVTLFHRLTVALLFRDPLSLQHTSELFSHHYRATFFTTAIVSQQILSFRPMHLALMLSYCYFLSRRPFRRLKVHSQLWTLLLRIPVLFVGPFYPQLT